MDLAKTIEQIKLGYLPRREESFEDFFFRIECAKVPVAKLGKSLIEEGMVAIPEFDLEDAYRRLDEVFGIKPLSTLAFYSSKGLGWLHLGALMEVSDFSSQPLLYIQLHNRWKGRTKWCGYRLKEVLAHEMVHYIRHGSDSGRFEEFLAYSLDHKVWRRKVGPLFFSPNSAVVTLLSLTGITIGLWLYVLESDEMISCFPYWQSLCSGLWLFSAVALSGLIIKWLYNSYQWERFWNKSEVIRHKREKSDPNGLENNSRENNSWINLMLHEEEIKNLGALSIEQWSHYLNKLPPSCYKEVALAYLVTKL